MLKITVKVGRLEEEAGLIVLPLLESEKPESLTPIPSRFEELIGRVYGKEFKGKLEEVYTAPVQEGRLMMVGLGRKEELELDALRRAYGKAAVRAGELGEEKMCAPILHKPFEVSDSAQAAAEGALLSAYRFDRYKSEKEEPRLREVVFVVGGGMEENARRGVEVAEKVCAGVYTARDIANTPSSDCHPGLLAKMVEEEGKKSGFKVRILGARELEEMGMGGILAVGRGSAHEPRLIILEYDGTGSGEDERPYVVVGKAITFDSGGISIKPSEKMEEMKYDKSGGAAVVGIVKAAALLKLPIRLIGLIPAAENMPSGSAYKPGDIVRFRNGKTAEIINTDAEGRLILADALAYGAEQKPKAMIDLATLTGACVIALGTHASGLLTNNQELAEKIKQAAEKTGERVWQLPLWKQYKEQLKSEVADMKNVGGRPGGAITAAAFLSNFVSDAPWVHLDIAGTAWTQETSEQKSYIPKGATGVGVRLVIDYLINEVQEAGHGT